MTKPGVATTNIDKFYNNKFENSNDLLAVEEPLEIRLGFGKTQNRQQKSIAVTMRTPGNDFELALGFLITEGIINSIDDVISIKYCTEKNLIEQHENIVRVELKPEIKIDFDRLNRHFYTTSSCGVCGKSSIEAVSINCKPVSITNFSIEAEKILKLPETIKNSQLVFEHTGGLHASALFDKTGNLLFIREDVGRHNALDKLIGAVKSKNLDLSQSILLLSGRASFELIQKSAVAGIPIVCAIGAPSSLAVNLAQNTGITLIGFLRGERFNIYSFRERII
ncbi:MAG: formate dehydrogenase accessory sulfurtransferase FdhD [Bacteroidia bacterium]